MNWSAAARESVWRLTAIVIQTVIVCRFLGDHKSVGSGVLERRINFEKGYRLYFAKDGDELIILFCGGTKSRQQSDIEDAKRYWLDYKNRKKQDMKGQEAKAKSQQEKRRR